MLRYGLLLLMACRIFDSLEWDFGCFFDFNSPKRLLQRLDYVINDDVYAMGSFYGLEKDPW